MCDRIKVFYHLICFRTELLRIWGNILQYDWRGLSQNYNHNNRLYFLIDTVWAAVERPFCWMYPEKSYTFVNSRMSLNCALYWIFIHVHKILLPWFSGFHLNWISCSLHVSYFVKKKKKAWSLFGITDFWCSCCKTNQRFSWIYVSLLLLNRRLLKLLT